MRRALLTGALAVFVLLALGPPLLLFTDAFIVDGEFSLGNFDAILLNERQVRLLEHTVILGLLTSLFACLVGVPFGAVLARLKIPGEGLLRFFYLLPVMLPTYVIGIAWTEHVPLRGLWGTVVLLGLSYWPIVALFTEKGLRAVGRDLESAASVSVSPSRVFTAVSLRLAMPSIMTGVLFVFIFAVSDFGIPDLLSFTTGSSYQVFSSEVFYRWDKLRRPGEAVVASLPIVCLCLAALVAILRLEGRAGRASLSGRFAPSEPMRAGAWTWPLLGAMVLAVAASVVVPLVTFVLWLRRAGGTSSMVRTLKTSLESTGPDAFNSVLSSVLAALLMVAVGFFIAYAIERSTGWKRWTLGLTALLPLAFPALMLGVGAVRFWNHPWNPISDAVYDRQPMLIFTYFARFIPIAVLCLRSSLNQVDRSMEEASQMAGRGFAYTAARVLIPLCWRGIWVAFLLGYIFSMRELDTIAIIGAGNDTLPFRIYSQIHTSRDVVIAAHCIVLIMTLLVPPLIYRLMVRGRVRIV